MRRRLNKVITLAVVFAMVLSITTVALAADWSSFPLQQQGSSNDYVRAIETVVKYYNPTTITPDTSFTSGTKSAVITYQSNSGFSTSQQDGIVGTQTWNSMYGRLSSATRITGSGTGNGSASSTGGYYGYRLYQRTSGSYTSLYYFRVDVNHQSWFDVYLVGSGSNPGTWYWVNPRT